LGARAEWKGRSKKKTHEGKKGKEPDWLKGGGYFE